MICSEDPEKYDINLLFECSINKKKLIDGLKSAGNIKKEKFIRKYITTYRCCIKCRGTG